MKRELAFASQTQFQLTGSLGRTRASANLTQRSSKRFKGGGVNESESNGEIDGSQEKSEINGSIDQNQEKKVRGSQRNVIAVYRRTRRFKNANSEVEQKVGVDGRLETVVEDKTKCNLGTPMCEDENKGELADASTSEELRDGSKKISVNEGASEVVRMVVDENNEAPSALNSKSKSELVDCLVSVAAGSGVADSGENEKVLNVEVNESSMVCALGTPTKKLELKMSKKVALGRTPETVKDLFATGLLEGYSVFYNGGNKGSAVRGMIKDVGILCFCSSCKGSRVVNPCQFEIHACKSYRRAAQYICLENGKSLLQVVKACRSSPLETLEETIQSVIGPLPEKKSIICQNCEGPFLATFAEKVEQLCQSCVGLKILEATPTHSTETNSSKKPDAGEKSKPAVDMDAEIDPDYWAVLCGLLHVHAVGVPDEKAMNLACLIAPHLLDDATGVARAPKYEKARKMRRLVPPRSRSDNVDRCVVVVIRDGVV